MFQRVLERFRDFAETLREFRRVFASFREFLESSIVIQGALQSFVDLNYEGFRNYENKSWIRTLQITSAHISKKIPSLERPLVIKM